MLVVIVAAEAELVEVRWFSRIAVQTDTQTDIRPSIYDIFQPTRISLAAAVTALSVSHNNFCRVSAVRMIVDSSN